jgi:uncharacterized protein YqjF (DUF2071 family)
MKLLKKHPFAVEAYFESSLVLTFAVEKEQLQGLIPDRLALDIFQDRWAFIAVAMVRTKSLRPKGFPEFMGNDFFLIGYRVFVRYTNRAGKRLRGLYILKSETDKRKMEYLGNIFTHYNYTTTDISEKTDGGLRSIRSEKSNFEVLLEPREDAAEMPVDSPFTEWKDARRFAGPLPYTFTCSQEDGAVLIVEGVRQHWNPEPVKVRRHYFGFLEALNLQNAVLASAFEIRGVPYYWKKGRIEKWN